jgi:chemotaxis signal transduction protein
MSIYTRFKVAAESYAVPVANVLEITDVGEVAAVPGARPDILGVRNLRGEILPVIDLAAFLGITGTVPPRRLLVAESGGVKAGFAIDEVSDVGELPDPAQDGESDFLLGTMLHDGELIGVIDVPRVFDSIRQADDERA